MLFLLIEFLFNKRLQFGAFDLHLGFPLSEGLQTVTHLIHCVEVCDVELLGNLIRTLLNQPLEVNLSLFAASNLRFQKLLERIQSAQNFLVPFDLIQTLTLGVFYYCCLQVLIILFEVLECRGDIGVRTVIIVVQG